MNKLASTQLRPPKAGEKTRRQTNMFRSGVGWNNKGYEDVEKAFPAKLGSWEEMLHNPTIAMGMAIKIAPILAASWSWKVKPGIPNGEQIKDWVQSVFDPLRRSILGKILRSMGVGCKSVELVWDVKTHALPGVPVTRWEICKAKGLSNYLTRVIVDNANGRFAGVTNAGVQLGPGEVLHYPFDFDAEDGGWYGRPLLENMRREYYEYKQDCTESQKLIRKLAGIVPMLKILKGMAKDKDGNTIDRFDIGLQLIQSLAQAKGIAFESILSDEADLRANPDLLKISDMDLSVLDLGSTTPAVASMLDRRKQFQTEFMQGLILPPRTALEAQFGSRADAEEQGDVGEVHTELVHNEATQHVNWYAVDPMLVYNLGEQYRGAVYAEAGPIRDKDRALLKQVLDKLLTNAATIDLMMSYLDEEAVMERLHIPMRATPIVVNPQPTQPVLPTTPPPAPGVVKKISTNYGKANGALTNAPPRPKV